MPRTPRIPGRSLVATLTLVAVAACAPASDTGGRRDFDRAVEHFVAGEYRATVEGMERVVSTTTDEAVVREAYTYMGRAHMALGRTDDAIRAFTLGAQHGDRGPCVAYLELLKQYVEGDPGALHVREAVTRGELAGAVVRLMLGQTPAAGPATGPTPLALLAERGWLPASPDGREHAEDPVTRAALYVLVARLLADAGRSDRIGAVLPGGYRSAAKASEPVSGTEALAVLERVRSLKEHDGR